MKPFIGKNELNELLILYCVYTYCNLLLSFSFIVIIKNILYCTYKSNMT